MRDAGNLRSWSSLTEDEQTALLIEYQPVVDCEAPTCSFDIKMARMSEWLRGKGISITEADVREPRTKGSERKEPWVIVKSRS